MNKVAIVCEVENICGNGNVLRFLKANLYLMKVVLDKPEICRIGSARF